MKNTTVPDEVLKADAMGRVRTSQARRQALLEEFARSGVSGKKFAALVCSLRAWRESNMPPLPIEYWVARRRQQRAAGEGAGVTRGQGAIRLFEAVVEGHLIGERRRSAVTAGGRRDEHA